MIDELKTGETYLSIAYLKWRYKDNSFRFASFSNKAFVVYKLSTFKGIKTIMVYNVLGNSKLVSALISAVAFKEKTIIFYGFFGNKTKKMNFKLIFKRNTPIVVWRDDLLLIHNTLSFSLGDLEGKL